MVFAWLALFKADLSSGAYVQPASQGMDRVTQPDCVPAPRIHPCCHTQAVCALTPHISAPVVAALRIGAGRLLAALPAPPPVTRPLHGPAI
eukprot:jgi/Ulvmu1/7115/UM034_0021.1